MTPAETNDDDLLCGHCGHNLRGISSDHCPECGQPFDPSHLLSSLIPWETRRATRKPIHAFLATIWTISFHPMRLIKDEQAPVTLPAALRFRTRIVLILFLMPAVPSVGYLVSNSGTRHWVTEPIFWTAAVALPLSLIALTGMASLFFAPRRLPPQDRSRAVAVSLYLNALFIAAGPLVALGFLSGLITMVTQGPRHARDGDTSYAAIFIFFLAAALPVAWMLATWIIPCRLLYRLTRSRLRVVCFAILWPVGCVLALVVPFLFLYTLVTYAILLRAMW